VPPIAYGIPLATVLYKYHLGGTELGVILANLVPSVPFVVLTMTPFIEQIDPKIEAAARMCGAGTTSVFTRVLGPLLQALDDQPLLCECEDDRPCPHCEPPVYDVAA